MRNQIERCGYSGCNNVAVRCLKLRTGRKQTLNVCGPHSPKWSYDGTGSPFYAVSNVRKGANNA